MSYAKIVILFDFARKNTQSFIISSNITIFALMKRAIVIGASSGIGREVCEQLLAGGWNVGVAARREEKLMEIKKAYPGRVEAMRIDVTSSDAPARLLDLAGLMGGVNLFVYCAGVGKQNTGLDQAVELSTVDVNVKGFTAMVGTMFNYMAGNLGGDIAVISSIAGTKGLGAAPSYSATKAYQNIYVQALEQLANMRRLHIRFTDIRRCLMAVDITRCSWTRPSWHANLCVPWRPTAMCKSSIGVTACWWRCGGQYLLGFGGK